MLLFDAERTLNNSLSVRLLSERHQNHDLHQEKARLPIILTEPESQCFPIRSTKTFSL
jgi:hypothetical protein